VVDEEFLSRLRECLGERGLLTAAGDMAPYLREWRGHFQCAAGAVARPANTDETAAVVAACAEAGVGIVPQGGNTGLVGGAAAQSAESQIVLALDRMTRIREIDTDNDTITVEAGCILAEVQNAAAGVQRFFPLSLAAEGSCRIGGNLATNAGGVNVLRYGNARDLTLGLEVVLADGRVWHGLSGLRKDNTGYDLRQLFVGSEGTLGIITAATLRLFPAPAQREAAFAGVENPAAAVALLGRLRAVSGDNVIACELLPRFALELTLRHIPGCRDPLDAPHPWYLQVELASPAQGNWLREALESGLEAAFEAGEITDAALAGSLEDAAAFRHIREHIPEAQIREGASIKHDVAVPVSRLPEFVTRATAAIEEEMAGVRVCAFGHVGDGNLHFNLQQPEDADGAAFLKQAPKANRVIHDIVAELDGSFSAEHGIGRLKTGELIRYADPAKLDAMRAIKQALDPKGILNPGVLLADN
jgi:D-lactate dehydrogenase (cytochrome)